MLVELAEEVCGLVVPVLFEGFLEGGEEAHFGELVGLRFWK